MSHLVARASARRFLRRGTTQHRPLGADCLARRTHARRMTALLGRAMGLRRERAMRRRTTRLVLQRTHRRTRAFARWGARFAAMLTGREIALRRFTRRALAAFGCLQRHTGAPRLRQADRDRLLRRARPVFALANVVHLF